MCVVCYNIMLSYDINDWFIALLWFCLNRKEICPSICVYLHRKEKKPDWHMGQTSGLGNKHRPPYREGWRSVLSMDLPAGGLCCPWISPQGLSQA